MRRDIRAAALSEQITRNMDEVFASAPYLTSMRQYYVPLQDTGARHSKKSTSVEEYYANVGKMTSDSPTARPEKTTISALSIPFRDVNDALPAQRSSVERRQFGSSTAATRSGIARVPDRFFWGRARSVADRAQLFREFKQYMVQQLNSGEINLDAAFSAEERKLQSALESAGFDSSTGVVRKAIVPKLRDAFLSDMDLHRDSIVDGLERAILSSELPDRLVMLHGVLRDTQVGAAAKLARGEAVLPYLSDTASGESGDGGSDKIAKKIANKLGAMSRRANSVDLSGVSYGQILGIK